MLWPPGGGTVTYAYDAVGRRTGIDYSDGTPDVTYVYDDAGRTVQMLDGTGTTTYSYDDLNRLTGTTHAGASVGYAWDDVSRLTALTYPSGDVVTRTYDDAGQLATVTDWAGREFAFDWTDDGRLAQVSYPNGVVTSYERDVAGQVTGLTAASQAGLDLLELAYGYSDAGLMTDRTTTRGTDTDSAQFAWDPLARLDAVTGTGAGDVGFDAAGSVTVLPDGRELTYDAGRQLTALTVPGADDTVVTTAFTYDARGNRLTAMTDTGPGAGTVTHTYDLSNRLTSITSVDDAVTTYTYDGNGLRATATTVEATESFTWDLAAAYPLLLTDADHAYVYGTAGVPLAQIALDDDAVDYLHTDTIGSVLAATTTTGEVTAQSDYDEYGLPLSVGGADPVAEVTRFGYAGEYADTTGHLYLRARYYDPTTAQFLTVDPLVDTTGNPYGYTVGNPLQYVDPLGLDWDPTPWDPDSLAWSSSSNAWPQPSTLGQGGLPIAGLQGTAAWTSNSCPAWGSGQSGGGSEPEDALPPGLHRVGQVIRFLANEANPVTALASGVAVTLAQWSSTRGGGGSCEFNWDHLMTVCTGAEIGYSKGGTEYGNVFVTGEDSVEESLLRHEERHSEQWAALGGVFFPATYGLSYSIQGECNVFEEDAGFQDGRYAQC